MVNSLQRLALEHVGGGRQLQHQIFTGVLFMFGKIIIGLLLSLTVVETVFGNTGSFVLVLLFVFYSSFIFYYGAAFTKAWADENDSKFQLEKNVRRYHVKQTA